ncbi:MAG: HAMP domain-containing histidine kinase [Cyanobacteria bacterium]|nr:HAMP domain-containing histidine kinase [Cyanobacteriota bacterium]
MKNTFKRSGGSVTNLRNNNFSRARIKLTLFYAISIALLVIFFSIIVYILFITNIINIFVHAYDITKTATVVEARGFIGADRLQIISLIIGDLIIILISIAFGYYLSGRTLQPIKQSLEMQKNFIANSAHEFKTPLTIMKTGIETISGEKKKTLKDFQDLNKDLLEEVDKLIKMSEDLQFLAQSDDNIKSAEKDIIDISSICSKQISFMQSYADKKEVVIKEDIKGPYFINANAIQITRMLTNLIKNAIDYNKPGGNVSVSLQKSENNIILKIKDSGIGISPEDLKHIFERFYKADKSRSPFSSGAGLGLSIVKEIVEYNNGTIGVKSQPDNGTEVTISFKSIN